MCYTTLNFVNFVHGTVHCDDIFRELCIEHVFFVNFTYRVMSYTGMALYCYIRGVWSVNGEWHKDGCNRHVRACESHTDAQTADAKCTPAVMRENANL